MCKYFIISKFNDIYHTNNITNNIIQQLPSFAVCWQVHIDELREGVRQCVKVYLFHFVCTNMNKAATTFCHVFLRFTSNVILLSLRIQRRVFPNIVMTLVAHAPLTMLPRYKHESQQQPNRNPMIFITPHFIYLFFVNFFYF